MSEKTVEETLSEADRLIAALDARRAQYEAEHGPIRIYKDLLELIETAPIGEGLHIRTSHAVSPATFAVPEVAKFYCENTECLKLSKHVLNSSSHDRGYMVLPGNKCGCVLNYICKYCHDIHAVCLKIMPSTSLEKDAYAIKAGEWPPSGEPISSALTAMVGDGKCRDLLRKGYDCEVGGKGIGAFAYYRRIIEYRTRSVITKLKEIAVEAGSQPDVLTKLDEAINTDSYRRALELTNEVAPGILVTGQENPFLMLHRLVSGNIHKGSDAECLELAIETRLILQYVSARIESVISDHKALGMALNKAKQRTKRSGGPP